MRADITHCPADEKWIRMRGYTSLRGSCPDRGSSWSRPRRNEKFWAHAQWPGSQQGTARHGIGHSEYFKMKNFIFSSSESCIPSEKKHPVSEDEGDWAEQRSLVNFFDLLIFVSISFSFFKNAFVFITFQQPPFINPHAKTATSVSDTSQAIIPTLPHHTHMAGFPSVNVFCCKGHK